MNWSPYYIGLTPQLKQRFIIRVMRLYRTISFSSHDSLALSYQMKILISSAFTQITFGLRKHKLTDFTEIHVMPKKYSYRNSPYYSGNVSPKAFRITLSWAAVERGFEIHNDALNVCLHEFGHCLLLENRSSFVYYFFDHISWEEYKIEARKKFKKIRSNQNEFLRDYAGTNLMELFSVALEAFFEQPESFSSAEPRLYGSMSQLLKQDPRRKKHPLIN